MVKSQEKMHQGKVFFRHIQKGAVYIFFCIVFCGPLYAQGDEWQIEKSKHFIIHYQRDFPEYIRRVKKEAEYYYKSITEYLGFNRFDFWLWGQRCKIYLYLDPKEYQGYTGGILWSRGHVNVIKKEIRTYVWQDEFFDIILPHEMGHIVFREFVGFGKALPLWLDEGVACSQEKNNPHRLKLAKLLVERGSYVKLDELSRSNRPGSINPVIFYTEAASIIDFLLAEFGRGKFVDFCRELRDKDDWEKSLLGVYKFENLEELERRWIEYVSKGSGLL